MKNTIITTALIGIFTASITTSVVAAQDTVHFNAPINFAGTGCPVGSMTFAGEGTTTLSVIFSQYDAANPPADASSDLQRSSCNFAVPVHIPAGWQISLLTSDWRGFAAGEAELHREYFFADQTSGMTLITPFNDPDGIDYTESDSLESSSYTACQSEDRDVMLRINSALQAKSDESYIGIDTIDMNNKVIFKLNSRTCRRDGLPFLPLLLLQGTN
ncbi:DUF4360 domain-containing protein [Desulfobulbus sp. TB]|nr:DUF4360 domain-containing protein [Desulfobulbus sp. TB]